MKVDGDSAFRHRVWPAQTGALTLIRHEVRRWLRPFEVGPEVEDDLVLAVNEAASNAVDARGTRVLLRHALPGHPGAVSAHQPAPAVRAL